MLMLSLTHNYQGRYLDKIKGFLDQGIRVGRMYVSGGNFVSCHVCPAHFPPPAKEEGHSDVFGECPGCKTPFLFQFIDREKT